MKLSSPFQDIKSWPTVMPSVTSTLKCHRNTYSENNAMIYFQAETQKALNAGICKLVPQPTCLKKKKNLTTPPCFLSFFYYESKFFTEEDKEKRVQKEGSGSIQPEVPRNNYCH